MMRHLPLLIALLFFPLWAAADSLSDWMNLEQTRIDRTVDEDKILAPDIANQAVQFRPESQAWFPLKSVWVPESELHSAIQEDQFAPDLKKLFVKEKDGQRYLRLLIHPESENFYSEITKKYPVEEAVFEASSTASSRTVLVRPKGKEGPNFFAKLSLDVKLGGVTRTVPLGEVARSVGLSRYGSVLEKERPGPFTIMKEVMGISPKGWERGGMILRQIPDSVTKNETSLVPLFSLYAKSGEQPTLLEEMAKRAKMKPSDFFAEKILKPFYQGWVDWNVNGAVTMEAHAQNVLLEVDKNGNPTGNFVHRDLGGFNVDTASPLYKQRADLDIFTSLEKDYHLASSAKARDQSLRTYFDGGFLYNIDKELARIEPGYKAGSIQRRGYEILAQEFESATGLKIPAAKLTQLLNGSADMSPVVDSATRLVKENKSVNPLAGACRSLYQVLAFPR
jgi:hypothetical protein